MLTSPYNSKIKLVRVLAKKQTRQEKKQFVVEGVRLIEEAVQAGIVPAFVFYTRRAESDARARALLERLKRKTREVMQTSDAVMKAIANTETPQGILAVIPFIELPAPAHPQFVLILDALRDPGNVGTILRSARAAGVDLVLLASGTVDLYNDKVVRAAMGAHFHLPIRSDLSWDKIADSLRGIPRIYLADTRGEKIYSDADWSRPVALVIGGEAEGASESARKVANVSVRIPLRGGESLNAAMAATVLLFHAGRVR